MNGVDVVELVIDLVDVDLDVDLADVDLDVDLVDVDLVDADLVDLYKKYVFANFGTPKCSKFGLQIEVGGVFYTLEWPLKSSASSTELDMPPNIETIVQTSGSQYPHRNR